MCQQKVSSPPSSHRLRIRRTSVGEACNLSDRPVFWPVHGVHLSPPDPPIALRAAYSDRQSACQHLQRFNNREEAVLLSRPLELQESSSGKIE